MERPIDAELSEIGRRIRRWREQEGLTLQELARRSHLATSTVQKVETGQMIPSVAVILKLSRGLGRRAGELLHDGHHELDVLHLPSSERSPIGVREKMLVERLSADLVDTRLEMWRVTLHPGASSGTGAIRYDGEELAVCEAGVATFRIGEDEYRLKSGDSLHFKAHIPHSWRNDGQSLARFTLTGTLPTMFRTLLQGGVADAVEAGRP